MAVLVTGGAGYIGSVTAERLDSVGVQTVVLDNLSRGHRGAVSKAAAFYNGDIGDPDLISKIVSRHRIDACIHFAAYAYVGESVSSPGLYFDNNVSKAVALFSTLVENGVDKVVFSSTCATYGEPSMLPILETHLQQPASPYGWSKLFVERLLESYGEAYGMRAVMLRYFNAAGASDCYGEDHSPETHLIPTALLAASGAVDYVPVFGSNYGGRDGTAIRDFVHVSDLADAHVLGLKYLESGERTVALNLGTGIGHSVLDVIKTAESVTGNPIRRRMLPARRGDPSALFADATKAAEVLGWLAKRPDLREMIESAWKWMQAHPTGYKEYREVVQTDSRGGECSVAPA